MLTQAYHNISSANEMPWKKIKEKNDISIYVAKSDNSAIIKVKTTTIINASVTAIQKILENHQQRILWVPYLKRSKALLSVSATEQIEYAHFIAPWPASDRDFIYRTTLLTLNEDTISYSMKSEASSLLPEFNSIIRAELIESQYSLHRLANNKTRVDLVFHADLKGWLPVWIINIVQKALPYRMLKNLKNLAETIPAEQLN
jgi:hypothetical protein